MTPPPLRGGGGSVPAPRFSASARTLQAFAGLFDSATGVDFVRLPLRNAIACAWAVYQDMRRLAPPSDLFVLAFGSLSLVAHAWVGAVVVLLIASVVAFLPAALPAMVLFLIWFRYGLWQLWWSTVNRLAFHGWAALEAFDVIAQPDPDVELPRLMAAGAAQYSAWSGGRPWLATSVRLPLVLLAGWMISRVKS